MNLSPKQVELLLTVAKKNADGTLVDLDQLIESQSYETNKQSIQFIVRNLVEKKLIEKRPAEKRRGRRRVLFEATPVGEQYAKWHTPKSLKEAITE